MNEEQDYVSYLRPDLEEMSGYQPGEQLNIPDIVKLNTNESPYPPSPLVMETLSRLDYHRLRLYPNPTSDPVREELGKVLCVPPKNIICGNGSDDILNIIIRSFTSPSLPMACLHPSYSLYPTLAKLNQTPCKMIELTENFDLPEDLLEQAKEANLLILTCPNAPTGNSFVMEKVEHICANFKGIVLIDEAYCDFAWFNCLFLFPKYKNVILSRTFSKSRALAGLRFGYAIAHENVINGLMKMKDSYNVSYLTQMLAIASLRDTEYFVECVDKIRYDREILKDGLTKRGFHVIESSANFLFAMPPDHNGERCFSELKKRKILVRYFSGKRTGDRVRISVGTNEDVQKVLAAVSEIYGV